MTKINIQGLPIAEHVNCDFVKVRILTDLLVFLKDFLTFSFLGFSIYLFHTSKHVLHIIRPRTKILPLLYGFRFFLI